MRRTYQPLAHSRVFIGTVVAVLVGGLIGALSALARPYAAIDGKHIEAMVELFFLMPLICLLIMAQYWRVELKAAIPAMCLQLALLWAGNLTGRITASINAKMLDDFFGVIIAFGTGSIVLTSGFLTLIRLIWPLRRHSTDCPGCGYSLIGLSQNRCPECGRPFTHHELGITEKDLIAQ